MPSSSCDFAAMLRPYKARVDVEFHRLLAQELRGIDISAEIRAVMNSLLWIERLTADHQDIFSCRCWHETEAL
jgi:hypothetical protein